MSGRALVAGVGNIFLRDDGFGSVAARRLAAAPWPDGVRIVDYGIRSLHLTYDLLDGYDVLVLLDATRRGGSPGEIVVLQVGLDDTAGRDSWPYADPHGMEPTSVLADLGSWGGRLPVTYVVGCEPADLGEGMGLSAPVAAAVERTPALVAGLLHDRLRGTGPLSAAGARMDSGHPTTHAPADHPAHRSAPPSAHPPAPPSAHPPARQDKEPSG